MPAALKSWLETAQPGRVLIPGCGSGYEMDAFTARGWDVTAIDISPAAVERARQHGRPAMLADFFTHDFGGRPFDVMYERTFLCSMPPSEWPKYVARVAELADRLVGFFFYGHEEDGPPFPLPDAGIFAGKLMCIVDEPVTDSLPLFAGRERWQVWQKAR